MVHTKVRFKGFLRKPGGDENRARQPCLNWYALDGMSHWVSDCAQVKVTLDHYCWLVVASARNSSWPSASRPCACDAFRLVPLAGGRSSSQATLRKKNTITNLNIASEHLRGRISIANQFEVSWDSHLWLCCNIPANSCIWQNCFSLTFSVPICCRSASFSRSIAAVKRAKEPKEIRHHKESVRCRHF